MSHWIKKGLYWGIFMLLIMEGVKPLIFREEIELNNVLLMLPIWILAGLLFGYLLKVTDRGKTRSREDG